MKEKSDPRNKLIENVFSEKLTSLTRKRLFDKNEKVLLLRNRIYNNFHNAVPHEIRYCQNRYPPWATRSVMELIIDNNRIHRDFAKLKFSGTGNSKRDLKYSAHFKVNFPNRKLKVEILP